MKTFNFFSVGLLVFLALNASGAKTPSIELVQSVPVGTGLAHPKVPRAKDAWVEMITQAKSTIDMAHLYSNARSGESLDPVFDALKEASERGVKIRFIVSSKMAGTYRESIKKLKKLKGLDLQTYDIEKISGGVLKASYWIVDREEAFVGSQNFDWRALTENHELGIRLSSSIVVHNLERIFEYDWKIAKTGTVPEKLDVKLALDRERDEVIASPAKLNPPGVRSSEDALVELIRSAKRDLKIQLLDYSPVERKSYWPVLDNEIRSAASRGVNIQIVLSHWNLLESKLPYIQSLDKLKNIEIKISTIPLTSRGKIPQARVIRCKYMVVDGRVLWLGTNDWTQSDFEKSRNLGLIMRRTNIAKTAGEIFDTLWGSWYTQFAKYKKPQKEVRR